MLPGLGGFDVLRELRRASQVPVLMLTALGDEVDRIAGLEIGADDYLPKTFPIRRGGDRRVGPRRAPGAAAGTPVADVISLLSFLGATPGSTVRGRHMKTLVAVVITAAIGQAASTAGQPAASGQLDLSPGQFDLSPAAVMPPSPFKSVGRDVRQFFSTDTAHLLVAAGSAAIMARMVDQKAVEESQEHLGRGVFRAGNIGGGFAVQAGAAFGTWMVGRAMGNAGVATLGGDLVRAQILSQGIVQGVKITTRRLRPDGSNRHSFPSGHTASAFATAGVLKSHYGWKVGVPAFGFATYVGAARMSANKHHLSDVVMGAAIGIAAARTVTIGSGDHRFDIGLAPTVGGAAVTFTRRPE
jgi:CheY-like chemotaxis protein